MNRLELSEADFRLRLVQALEGIQDQLSRIRVAEGPCGAIRKESREGVRGAWGLNESKFYTYTETWECNLAAGHTGQHCTVGPFDDPRFRGDTYRWDQ